jgi:hypothetical protein
MISWNIHQATSVTLEHQKYEGHVWVRVKISHLVHGKGEEVIELACFPAKDSPLAAALQAGLTTDGDAGIINPIIEEGATSANHEHSGIQPDPAKGADEAGGDEGRDERGSPVGEAIPQDGAAGPIEGEGRAEGSGEGPGQSL